MTIRFFGGTQIVESYMSLKKNPHKILVRSPVIGVVSDCSRSLRVRWIQMSNEHDDEGNELGVRKSTRKSCRNRDEPWLDEGTKKT